MTVSDIFETMDYGAAPESAAEALAWIVDQGSRFGHFINGEMTPPGEVFAAIPPMARYWRISPKAPKPM